MSRVGFEPTIPVFQREKTVHALDRAATAIGVHIFSEIQRTIISELMQSDISMLSEAFVNTEWSTDLVR
jgi:hypothetical protein